jgi:predicted nucleic acid-binding protein
MLIIADSSALVALALCNGLRWLDHLFDEVKVPQTVFDEVAVTGKPAASTLREYLGGKTVAVDLTNVVITSGGLGRGEIEAMALYKTLHADYLLVDDSRARKVARLNQIVITGSQGILLLAKHHGLISQVKPYLDQLQCSDIRISERLIQKTLRLAGEAES